MRTMTPEELGCVAGLIMGEGTIGVYRTPKRNNRGGFSYMTVVHVSSALPELLLWLKETTGIGYVCETRRRNPRPGHSPEWYWRCVNRQASELLQAIRPLLVIKGEQADVAIETQRNRHVGRRPGQSPHSLVLSDEELTSLEFAYHRSKMLNKRGAA